MLASVTTPRMGLTMRLALVAGVILITLLAASSARAAVPLTNFYAGPITSSSSCNAAGTGLTAKTDGASRTDFCIAYKAASPAPNGDDLKSQVIDTPRGFSGEPDRFPQCTDAQFNYAANTSNVSCAANSQMGAARAQIRVATVLAGTQSLDVPGRVYNLVHSNNEVARLGIVLDPTFIGIAQPKVKILVRVTLRPSPDVGLRSIIDNLPRTANTNEVVVNGTNRPLATDQFALTFWGSQDDHPSMPHDYGMLGSDCSTPQQGAINAVAYDGTPTSFNAAPYNLTGCAATPFTPTVEFSTTENRPDVTTETSVNVNFANFDSPRTSASPKQTIVTLPTGLSFSGQIASGASGLPLCTPAQFNRNGAAHSTCPQATAVGTIKFTSPQLTGTLNGQAFLGPQPAVGQLPDLYIEAELGPAVDAPRVKLVGHLTIDDQNRIVTTVDDLPQVLVSQFALTFRGGDQAAVVTPPKCGTFQGALSATPYSSPTAKVLTADYTVDQDCAAVGAFTPAVAFAVANPNAGKSGAFTTTISRPDRQQRLGKTVIELPAGMLANLKGVPECRLADAAAGTCAEATKVGSVTASAGVGPAPYSTTGAVYLTTRESGAVAGLSFKVPVSFGEVSLGTLNIPARIDIRQDDLGLRIIADVPERFAGIPLNIRSMAVALDRQGFPLNPTSCSALLTTSQITSVDGTTAPAAAGLQVTNCGALPFDPTIDASVTGNTGYFGHPDLKVRVTAAPGSGALKQTFVTLPTGLAVDLKQIPRACKIADFKAGACADAAKIGTVSGTLAIADEPLGGDLYLLEAAPGTQLPGLGLSFTGRFTGRILGANAIEQPSGRLITKFESLPDLPLTAFQLNITGAGNGPIVANNTLCVQPAGVVFNARFVAHSGQTVSKTATTSCGTALGLSPKVSARLGGVRKGKPTLALNATAPGTQKIKSVDVILPKGYKLSPKAAKSAKSVKVTKLTSKGKKVKSKSASTKKTSKLRLTMPAGGTTRLRLITKTGTYAIASKKTRKSKAKVALSVKLTYTDGKSATVALKLTPR